MFHLFGSSWFSWPREARGQDTSNDGIDIQVFFYFHTKRATEMIELFSMHIGFTTSQELCILSGHSWVHCTSIQKGQSVTKPGIAR